MSKTISFAIMHISVAFGVVYLMTGDIALGGAVALVEPLCNTVGYFFHEKFWARHNRGESFRGKTLDPRHRHLLVSPQTT